LAALILPSPVLPRRPTPMLAKPSKSLILSVIYRLTLDQRFLSSIHPRRFIFISRHSRQSMLPNRGLSTSFTSSRSSSPSQTQYPVKFLLSSLQPNPHPSAHIFSALARSTPSLLTYFVRSHVSGLPSSSPLQRSPYPIIASTSIHTSTPDSSTCPFVPGVDLRSSHPPSPFPRSHRVGGEGGGSVSTARDRAWWGGI
jgi:hypothetical protein